MVPRVRQHNPQQPSLTSLTLFPSYDPYGNHTLQDANPTIVQRKWISNEPIFSPTNTSLTCNSPGTPARSSIPITAGQTLTAVYAYWIHTVGPMITWLAYCANAANDCTTFNASTASWFKIAQRGLEEGTIETGTWFQGRFSRWNGEWSLWEERIPGDLRAGRYLVRHEIISLHSANKPQFYAECAHLDVRGGGDGMPGEEYLVRIPGVWSMDRKFFFFWWGCVRRLGMC